MRPALKTLISGNQEDDITKEYEDFAYIVSHDLSAPLRHVKEFTRLLIGGRKENLTEEEQEYVAFLEKSLCKIEDMQKALLTFSRLNSRAGPLRQTNLNHAVEAALKEIDDTNAYRPSVEYDNLPTIIADQKQIELLFFHLIDNALKFHRDDTAHRTVSITASDQGDVWMFGFKDNGIGIAKEYHEEVLRMFRRLNPDKYKGIGAGLTIARKIVRRHGGEMQIESEENKGTNVLFTIKKHSPDV